MDWAFCFDEDNAGKRAITTSNSISVKAYRPDWAFESA
jgi:hypothetical protein